MEPRKHYTKEFKLDAVSLVLDQGLTIAEAAGAWKLGLTCLGDGSRRAGRIIMARHSVVMEN